MFRFRYSSKITNHPSKRICARCGKQFFIDPETKEVSGGECNYHAGKLYPDRHSFVYSCCKTGSGSEPCKYFDTHVHEENRSDLTGYNGTSSLARIQEQNPDKKGPACFGLDCEMVYTTVGFELVRVTLINDELDVVLDKFACPVGSVLDYNTKYSGVEVNRMQLD